MITLNIHRPRFCFEATVVRCFVFPECVSQFASNLLVSSAEFPSVCSSAVQNDPELHFHDTKLLDDESSSLFPSSAPKPLPTSS